MKPAASAEAAEGAVLTITQKPRFSTGIWFSKGALTGTYPPAPGRRCLLSCVGQCPMLLVSRRRGLPESSISLLLLPAALAARDLLGSGRAGLVHHPRGRQRAVCPAHFPGVAAVSLALRSGARVRRLFSPLAVLSPSMVTSRSRG